MHVVLIIIKSDRGHPKTKQHLFLAFHACFETLFFFFFFFEARCFLVLDQVLTREGQLPSFHFGFFSSSSFRQKENGLSAGGRRRERERGFVVSAKREEEEKRRGGKARPFP